jgi:CheY-like chemotaxis protein
LNAEYFGKYEWENKTILIVEDDVSSVFYLKEVLADTDADLIIVKDGDTAINECKMHQEIDLVLMDIQLPRLDGYYTTSRIKEFRPKLPVIAQTACALIEDIHKCKDAGCDDYIAKPIEPVILLDKMSKFLNN